jgi:hypothetical protein
LFIRPFSTSQTVSSRVPKGNPRVCINSQLAPDIRARTYDGSRRKHP